MKPYAEHPYDITLHAGGQCHSVTLSAESDDYAMRSACWWASCKLTQIEADQGRVTVWRDGREVGSLVVRAGAGVPSTKPSA